MANRWIVTAAGKDRPGIVAGVAKILYQLGCNLEDSAMTRLAGEFAVMLIFAAPAKQTDTRLRQAFVPLERRLKLAVHLKPLTGAESAAPKRRGKTYVISVYGADKPGIVFHVSEALARLGVNINDLHTHRTADHASGGSRQRREGGPSLYLLLLEVELPAAQTVSALERRLAAIAKRLGVEVSVRPSEADVL